ncbi:hypothetical protein CDAR_221261 [Caerostris darwini]|uniref:Uncharacterized protein n=1 Tax=Caerostris darwini TaxID=1538125 RepID=A0AAV4WPL0_9ARAC|nr:hypothetical protein CDAR_221261 [Caerostris darwini]
MRRQKVKINFIPATVSNSSFVSWALLFRNATYLGERAPIAKAGNVVLLRHPPQRVTPPEARDSRSRPHYRAIAEMATGKHAAGMPQKVGRNISCAMLCWFTILELEVIGQGWIFLIDLLFFKKKIY